MARFHSIHLAGRLQRLWWQSRGEQPILAAFWPQDFQRDTSRWIAGKQYHITRYVRAADPRFFEVWGRAASLPSGWQTSVASRKARIYPRRKTLT